MDGTHQTANIAKVLVLDGQFCVVRCLAQNITQMHAKFP